MLASLERVPGNLHADFDRDRALWTAGNTLYLPIEVEGGLLSCGDGHVLQADGECAGSAIECPMEVTVGLEAVDLAIDQPIIETPEGWDWGTTWMRQKSRPSAACWTGWRRAWD